tara:strand:- start:2059 stop:2211 length:153 start_codon:yes stop_codon:yes gene_type:complete
LIDASKKALELKPIIRIQIYFQSLGSLDIKKYTPRSKTIKIMILVSILKN